MKTKLQEYRIQAGYKSACKFAECFGINKNTYTSYEQGVCKLPIDKAVEFADFFQCSLDELVGREQEIETYPLEEVLKAYICLDKQDQKAIAQIIFHLKNKS